MTYNSGFVNFFFLLVLLGLHVEYVWGSSLRMGGYIICIVALLFSSLVTGKGTHTHNTHLGRVQFMFRWLRYKLLMQDSLV